MTIKRKDKTMKTKIKEAEKYFDKEVIQEVVMFVEISDPDGCYTLFQDYGWDNHSECLEFIYFE